MGSMKSLALAGVFAAVSSASALAADLLPPPPPMHYPPPPVEFGGWYLRGDVDARTGVDAFGVGSKAKSLDAQEVRLGVRYVID
jgi:hypothetical protein